MSLPSNRCCRHHHTQKAKQSKQVVHMHFRWQNPLSPTRLFMGGNTDSVVEIRRRSLKLFSHKRPYAPLVGGEMRRPRWQLDEPFALFVHTNGTQQRFVQKVCSCKSSNDDRYIYLHSSMRPFLWDEHLVDVMDELVLENFNRRFEGVGDYHDRHEADIASWVHEQIAFRSGFWTVNSGGRQATVTRFFYDDGWRRRRLTETLFTQQRKWGGGGRDKAQ